jgi:hypothetical protein
MLDLKKFPCKPVYPIASEVPLVLWECGYRDGIVQWRNEPETHLLLWKHFVRLWEERSIRGTIVTSMLRTITEGDLVLKEPADTATSDISATKLVPWTQMRDITPDEKVLALKHTSLLERDKESASPLTPSHSHSTLIFFVQFSAPYSEKIEGIMARLERTGKTRELARIKKILAENAAGIAATEEDENEEDFGE